MLRSVAILTLVWCLSSARWAPYKQGFPEMPTVPLKTPGKIPKIMGAVEEKERTKNATRLFGSEFYQGEIPNFVDYRINSECITGVKDQNDQNGQTGCSGTCWAFATTGLLEYYYCLAEHSPVSFSEKYLVDCVGNGSGCTEGRVDHAVAYAIENHRMPVESEYPYNTHWQECGKNFAGVDLSNLGFKNVRVLKGAGDDILLQSLASIGPVAVNLHANFEHFLSFETSDPDHIYTNPECDGSPKVDHNVLVVGYGSNQNGDYWLIKNSWGVKWGLEGYVKLSRGTGNYCSISEYIYVPNFA